MKRILYILKHDPWGVSGGCYASLMYLSAFRKLFSDYQFDVCICKECMNHQPETWKGKCNFIPVPKRSKPSRILSIFTGIMHRHQQIAKELISENNYDYCIFDHSCIAGTLYSYLKPNTKSIVIHHNYEPQYFKDNTHSLLYKILFLRHVKSAERNAYLNCTYNIFLTSYDEKLFKKIYIHPLGKTASIGIFDIHENKSSICQSTSEHKIVSVITGALDNIQNTDGILYFIHYLYPHIVDRCDIIIAGKNPTQAVIDAVKPYKKIALIPNPKNMDDILSQGNIFICPTRLGGGIKVRVADGLRNGIPVIAHSVSARGYDDFTSKGYLFPYNTPEEFLSQFNTVENKIKGNKLNHNEIASFYKQNNSVDVAVKKLKLLLNI